MTQAYQYERINTDKRGMRLLIVHSASNSNDHMVHCNLKRISLFDREIPEYTTISYTWGADNPKTQILIDGKPLAVPINAEKAIRYFRLPNQDRILWIDAACINQKDDGEDGEKGPHVRYMSLVYSKAKENLVHLGDDDDGLAGLAFKTVRYLRDNRLSMLNDQKVKSGSDEAKALTSLFSRPWFRRAWVVQEVVLGGRNCCFLGKHHILIRAFLDCALFVRLNKEWQSDAGQLTDKFGRETTIAIENLITLRQVREMHNKKEIQDKPDIATLIQRKRQCKNPRDMVYSIIGLWDPDVTRKLPPRLTIRYQDTVADVYTSATRYSLETRDGPYILLQVTHRTDSELELSEIPTWAPQWHRDVEEGAPHGLSVHFHCWHPWNELVKPKDKCDDPLPNVLRLDGIKIDTVKTVTEPLREEHQRNPTALNNFVTASEETAGTTGKAAGGKAPTDGDIMDGIAETLIAGCHSPHKLGTEEDWAPFKTFRDHLTRIAQQGKDERLPQAMPMGEGRKAYFTRLVTACLWRRFFVTNDGHLGLGPRATRAGDVVVALRNGMWPFVLRPNEVSGEEPKYQFLGQAYLRGHMQGEAVQGCKDGKRKVEPFSMV